MCKHYRLGDYHYSPIEGAGDDAQHSSAIALAGGTESAMMRFIESLQFHIVQE